MPTLHTFSIVAHDPAARAWGVAVASKFLAAGALVSWARAGAGAVATQAFAKVGFGPAGLELMAGGLSAQETLDRLLRDDPFGTGGRWPAWMPRAAARRSPAQGVLLGRGTGPGQATPARATS